jgi:hypothetical protein
MKLYLALIALVAATAAKNHYGIPRSTRVHDSLSRCIKRHSRQSNQIAPTVRAVSKRVGPISKLGTEQDGRNFINYASAAYCPQEKLTSWNCANCVGYAAGSSEIVYFQDTNLDSAGFLAVNKNLKLIVLSYRGTDDLENWLYDLDVWFTSAGLSGKNSNAEIHPGFNDMAMSLLSQTTSSLKSAIGKYPDYKIVLTGHSLGGAIAALIGFNLGQTNVIPWEKLNVITYGQPRVGNPAFASFLNTKPWTFTRITAYSDIVPISPGISMDYYHNQYNMHINSSGQTIKCSVYQEDDKCIDDFWILSEQAHFHYWNLTINSDC